MPSPSSLTEEWEFNPDPSSTRDVRRLVVRTLESSALEELVTSAALVVSELATNAVLHARTTFIVRLRMGDGMLRIEVEDRAAGRPAMRNFSNQATSGRGLQLVDGLSRSWGVTPLGRGKLVWAEIVADTPVAASTFDVDSVEPL